MKEKQAIIVVQVQPNASQSRAVRFENGIWHVRIAAPPTKGKANQELVKFISSLLNVAKSRITIEKGLTGKRKVIAIAGLSQEEVVTQLTGLKM